MDRCSWRLAVMVVLLLLLGLLWEFSATLVTAEFKHGGSDAQFWFACIVGPLEVWIRWFLAWFNGFGSGRTGILKGIPFGTLAANKSAAGVMAALASVHKAASF